MSNNNILNKKRERTNTSPIIISLGKQKNQKNSFYYISDTLSSNKIKIPISSENINNPANNNNSDTNQNNNNQNEGELHNSISSIIVPEEIPEILKAMKNNENSPIFLPSCSSWFNFDNINEIEIKSLPEFFCGKYPSKTPEVYKAYRNFIINLYRENQNTYLSATTCRRHLAGDACAILRIHAFLEHWGIINFKVDPLLKPTNMFLPKSFNFKNPIYIDATSLLLKDNNNNSTNKIGNNNIIIVNNINNNNNNSNNNNNNQTNLNNNQNNSNDNNNNNNLLPETRTLYPINNHPESMFRSFFNKNSNMVNHQINFLTKNYRPKCDLCMNLCDLDWYITKESVIKNLNNNNNNNSSFLICENCYEKNLFPKDLKKEDFELSNIFNIFEPNNKITEKLSERIEKEKWTKEETKKLIDLIEKFGENWEEIEKNFEGKKTKADCIIHLMQLPIKENIQFKIMDNNLPKNEIDNGFNIKSNEINAINDQNNPLISQVVFFAKIFEKFINQDAQNYKEKNNNNNNIEINKKNIENVDYSDTKNLRKLIYKTYAKTIDNSKKLIKNEKNEMKKYMDLLIYLQMKKIELKLNYFNEFEKMIEFKKNQIKTMESQIVQDRIKLSIKRNDLLNLISKIKESQKKNNNNFSNIEIENFQNQSDKLNNESNNQIIDIV